MELTNKSGTGDFSWILKAILLLAFGACAYMSGCRASPTWSAESSSPDGKKIATAKTFEQSGFGTGFVQTTVYLNWTAGSQPKMLILAFSDGPVEPGGMNVGMKWLTPTHLELTFKGQRPLDFQAVKCDGVDISVRDLSNGHVSPSQ